MPQAVKEVTTGRNLTAFFLMRKTLHELYLWHSKVQIEEKNCKKRQTEEENFKLKCEKKMNEKIQNRKVGRKKF